ncbi:MAG: hypothetical protein K2O42_08655 [Oscillospiraceae bacterium]|nr:hypothetical protein [Oscillospiraceae bacterium]
MRHKLYYTFAHLRLLETINIVRDGIPEDLQTPLSIAIEQSETGLPLEICQSYEIDDCIQLLTLEILNLIKSQKMIKRCRNCDKYFIIKNRKNVYCDRKDKSGVTCSDIGYKLSFQKKLEEDEPLKLYNRAYKTHYARYQRGKLDKKELDIWREQANDKLNKVRNRNLALEEYQKWLKK